MTPARSSAANQALDCCERSSRGSCTSVMTSRPPPAIGDLAVALQRLGAVLARLARRNADLDQLAVGEQAQRLRRAEQAAPVEVRAGDGVHLALAAAGGARGGADRVGGLLGEQRLVAPHGVDGAQLALELAGEAVGGDLHRSLRLEQRTEASRRSTCETMSLCIDAVEERLLLLLRERGGLGVGERSR